MKQVDVKCRRCGRPAPADSFVLDHVFRMMVCPACAKDRRAREQYKEKEAVVKEQPKPVEEEQKVIVTEFDEDESYLFKNRSEKKPVEDNKEKHKCSSCGYEFNFNREKNIPRRCPYCNSAAKK